MTKTYSSLQIIPLHSGKQRNQLLAQCHLIYLQNQRQFLPPHERHYNCGFSLKRSLPKSGPKFFYLSGKVDKSYSSLKSWRRLCQDEEAGHFFLLLLRFNIQSYVMVLNQFILSSSKSIAYVTLGEMHIRHTHFTPEFKWKHIHRYDIRLTF